MKKTLVLALIAFPLMLALDLLWIGVLAAGFYRMQLGSMLLPDVLWPAALGFYVIYALAVSFFVLKPAFEKGASMGRVFLTGAFLGFAAYAAYDLTNLATITGWPLPLTIVDLLWGTLATALVSVATYLVAKKLLRY
jgi:uncharacterized membrane protein